jgi:hypothetical protein
MNKLQLFTRYYIIKVERGVDQSRNRGVERGFEFVNEKTFSSEEFVWRRATRNNLKIIKRGGVLSRWERILNMGGLLLLLPVRGETPKCSDILARVCK